MGLINPDEITVILARDIIAKDPALVSLVSNVTDEEILQAVKFVGGSEENIPVDENGYTTSEDLKIFGQYVFLHRIFEAVASSSNIDDAYSRNEIKFKNKASEKRKRVTLDTLVSNDVVTAADRQRITPSY